MIQDCKTMYLLLTDGRITFIAWDHRMITGPFVKEVSLQEESDFEKDDRRASSVDRMATTILARRYEANAPRNIPYTLKWRRVDLICDSIWADHQ